MGKVQISSKGVLCRVLRGAGQTGFLWELCHSQWRFVYFAGLFWSLRESACPWFEMDLGLPEA